MQASNPVFLKALVSPEEHGFPIDPHLKIPAIAWISKDPSPEAQALVHEIWATMPFEIQQECREIHGFDL